MVAKCSTGQDREAYGLVVRTVYKDWVQGLGTRAGRPPKCSTGSTHRGEGSEVERAGYYKGWLTGLVTIRAGRPQDWLKGLVTTRRVRTGRPPEWAHTAGTEQALGIGQTPTLRQRAERF